MCVCVCVCVCKVCGRVPTSLAATENFRDHSIIGCFFVYLLVGWNVGWNVGWLAIS